MSSSMPSGVTRSLVLELLAESFAICRLGAHDPVPAWALLPGAFASICRSPDELSIVCPDLAVPPTVAAERGYRALRVRGPLPFQITGVLAGIARPLADAEIPIFAISTYDTDYVLVRSRDLAQAVEVLREAGHVWPWATLDAPPLT